MNEWGAALHVIEKIVDDVQKSDKKKARKVVICLGKQMNIPKEDFLLALKTITNKLSAFSECEFEIKIIEDSNTASLETVYMH
jgi:Zn finger protein HypA/HybF involved in hydrogenase expression